MDVQNGPYFNIRIKAKYITYCCEAARELIKDDHEIISLIKGASVATVDYRTSHPRKFPDLIKLVMENKNDFVELVTQIIIQELIIDCPQFSQEQITQFTRSKLSQIDTVINKAKKDFPFTKDEFAIYARVGAVVHSLALNEGKISQA